MDYFERIEQVADLKGFSPSGLFKAAGMSGSVIGVARHRVTTLSPRTLKKLKKAFSDINLDYIENGIGNPLEPMPIAAPQIQQIAKGKGHTQTATIIPKDDPCSSLRQKLTIANETIGHLRSQLADKDKIISLLEGQLK